MICGFKFSNSTMQISSRGRLCGCFLQVADIFIHLRLQLADLFQRPFGEHGEVPWVLWKNLCAEAIYGSAQVLDLLEGLTELSFVLHHSLILNIPLVL